MLDDGPAVRPQVSGDGRVTQARGRRGVEPFNDRRGWIAVRHNAQLVGPVTANIELTGNRMDFAFSDPTQ